MLDLLIAKAQSRAMEKRRFMSKLTQIICMLAMALALSACGSRQQLQPQMGEELPPKSYGESESPTPEKLLDPDTQARPGHDSELLRRSEPREEDPFDLPPN